jgi:hypothetical protein
LTDCFGLRERHRDIDRVRRRELALKLGGQAEPFHCERFVDALFERSGGQTEFEGA